MSREWALAVVAALLLSSATGCRGSANSPSAGGGSDIISCRHPGGQKRMCKQWPDDGTFWARCLHARGEPSTEQCPRDDVLASCTSPDTRRSSFVYVVDGEGPEEIDDVVRAMKDACDYGRGKFARGDVRAQSEVSP